jgi:hypothetical protein
MNHQNKPTEQDQENFQKILKQNITNFFKQSSWQEDWKKFLDKRSQLYQYSHGNVLRMFAQNPDIAFVASREKWEAFGRQVLPDATGLWIYVPYFVKEEEINFQTGQMEEVKKVRFTMGRVYDLAETEGEPFQVAQPLTGSTQLAKETLQSIIAKSPLTIEIKSFTSTTNGYYLPGEKRIVLKESLSDLQKLKTLLHELAHYQLGHTTDGDAELNEIEAESTAYCLMQLIGLDSSEYSFPYILSWANGSLKKIKKTFLNIDKAIKAIAKFYNLEPKPELELELELA